MDLLAKLLQGKKQPWAEYWEATHFRVLMGRKEKDRSSAKG